MEMVLVLLDFNHVEPVSLDRKRWRSRKIPASGMRQQNPHHADMTHGNRIPPQLLRPRQQSLFQRLGAFSIRWRIVPPPRLDMSVIALGIVDKVLAVSAFPRSPIHLCQRRRCPWLAVRNQFCRAAGACQGAGPEFCGDPGLWQPKGGKLPLGFAVQRDIRAALDPAQPVPRRMPMAQKSQTYLHRPSPPSPCISVRVAAGIRWQAAMCSRAAVPTRRGASSTVRSRFAKASAPSAGSG